MIKNDQNQANKVIFCQKLNFLSKFSKTAWIKDLEKNKKKTPKKKNPKKAKTLFLELCLNEIFKQA